MSSLRFQLHTSAVRQIKPRLAPYCRVLPPGEFNGVIPVIAVYCESFNVLRNKTKFLNDTDFIIRLLYKHSY